MVAGVGAAKITPEVNDYLSLFCHTCCMDDNKPAQELIYETAKGKPWAFGAFQSVYNMGGLQDYLLSIPRDLFVYNLKTKQMALESTSCLTSPSFFSLPPYRGIPYFSFGQAIAQFGEIGIHYKIEGITLREFLQKYPEDAKERMADWKQEAFDGLMKQVVTATRKGHLLDIKPDNTILTDWHLPNPKITLIDFLSYDKPVQTKKSNRLDLIMELFRVGSGEESILLSLREKLLNAAEKTQLGFYNEQIGDAAFWSSSVFGKENAAIIDRLSKIPPVFIPERPLQHELPPAFDGIKTLAGTSSLGELRVFLESIRKADKLAHPDWLQ